MTLITLLTFLFLHFTLATATPLASDPASIQGYSLSNSLRSQGLPGGLYYCSEPNFRGQCFWLAPHEISYCARLLLEPSNDPNNKVEPQSLGPDEGGHCDLYNDRGCKPEGFIIKVPPPGFANVPKFTYIRCYSSP